MVSLTEVKAANASLHSTAPPGLVSVVVGGTNGIGKGFLYELAKHTSNPKIYIVGRNEATLGKIIQDLKDVNLTGTYIPILASDLTLVSVVRKTTAQIITQEKKIDLLFLSQGYLTLSGRDESPEGLDRISTIRYYGRMRFILDLLPLLEAAPSPRVVSVLAAGTEGTIYPDDLGLKQPNHHGAIVQTAAAVTYTTLFLEQLAKLHPKVGFCHTHPGIVRTNIFNNAKFNPVFKFFVVWILAPTVMRLISISAEEAGTRQLYVATSPAFVSAAEGASSRTEDALSKLALGTDGKRGSGAYMVGQKCQAVQKQELLQRYRDDGVDKKLWKHTVGELDRILGSGQ
ncbi:hypothetical protein B0H66DRAFT_575870 [Apodospora peruviana]|uniref:Uncharacterized protein n=1 Tax=Apodospora peruviana TaxID=516989 RepID=A0AAE0M682_9PEZI|nr:hypothetical protein B0H66DRAFT_575870 [Apodospora peruviana]